MRPTLEEAYCSSHRCDGREFRRALFWGSMYGHARIVARLLGGYEARYFGPERDLISGLAQARSVKRAREEIRFYFMNPATWGVVRRALRIRVSTTKLLAIARATLPETTDEAATGSGSSPPQSNFRGIRATM